MVTCYAYQRTDTKTHHTTQQHTMPSGRRARQSTNGGGGGAGGGAGASPSPAASPAHSPAPPVAVAASSGEEEEEEEEASPAYAAGNQVECMWTDGTSRM